MAYTEETYPFLLMEVMEYIKEVKMKDRSVPIIEIIVDFSKKQHIDLAMLGDAITDDDYFKTFIEKDCVHHGIFKSNKIGEW